MYRLYIDETGNADLGSSADPNHRYLSLTGIMIQMDHVQNQLIPEIENIKREIFDHDPDDPIIFHRKELVNRKWPFIALRDPEVERRFNERMLSLMTDLEYRVFTAVIDKQAHLNFYNVWHKKPYHYCLEVLLERYVLVLRSRGSVGDVMAEVRGGKVDMQLEKSYTRLYDLGNNNIPAARFQRHLTSRDIKMRRKDRNIAGLQFADLIAHPSAMYARSIYADDRAPDNFPGQIIEILKDQKYHRYRGRLEGSGIKWLP